MRGARLLNARQSSFTPTASDSCRRTVGHAVAYGDDPASLNVTRLGVSVSSTLPWHGRYPCGSLIYNGTWFYGTYLGLPSLSERAEW